MQNNVDFKSFKKEKEKEIITYLENTNESFKDVKISIVIEIFKHLTVDKHYFNQRIRFDIALWVLLHKKEKFKKNSVIVHNLIKELKKNKLIDKLSINFPKNHVIVNINPLTQAYLNIDLSEYDMIMKLKEDFLENIEKILYFSGNKDTNLEYEICLFIYFKLFILDKIPNSYYKYFRRENIIYVEERIILVVQGEAEEDFIPLNTIIFDESTSKILNLIFPKTASKLFDNNQYIFNEKYDFYEKHLYSFFKEPDSKKDRIEYIKNLKYQQTNDKFVISQNYDFYYESLNLTFRESKFSIRKIKNAVKFEYQLNNTGLDLTIRTSTKHPKLSLLELEKVFPNSVPTKLLEIEKNNLRIYRNINYELIECDEDDDEMDLQTQLEFNHELYEDLKKIIKVPRQDDLIPMYLKKAYAFIKKNTNKEKRLLSIFEYIKNLLESLEKKSIKPKTLRDYLYVNFDFCFDILVKSANTFEGLKKIDDNLKNSDLLPDVQNQYRSIINRYLKKELDFSIEKINSVINYNRSIVFEDELDRLVKKLQYRDKKLYNCTILQNRRAIFVILAYYSGLRKSELLSRTLKDLFYIENTNRFHINVNISGIKKINKMVGSRVVSFKNVNAKRAFNFEINNSKHLKLVVDYYKEIEKRKILFVFPGYGTKSPEKINQFIKKTAMKMFDVTEINSILQDTTSRLTPLHSLRHSFISRILHELLNKDNKKIEDIYDFLYKIGHDDFSTTLLYYAHLDLIFLNITGKIAIIK